MYITASYFGLQSLNQTGYGPQPLDCAVAAELLTPCSSKSRASWEHLGRSFYAFSTRLNHSYFCNSYLVNKALLSDHQTHSQPPSSPSTPIDPKLSDTFTFTTFYARAQLWSHWTTWSGTVEHPNLFISKLGDV
jgi:hypothetical protein